MLQRLLAERLSRTDIFVFNGAMRATSADFAALCFDEMWGGAWRDSRGVARAPRLDLAIIEYTWSSSPSQISSRKRSCAADLGGAKHLGSANN